MPILTEAQALLLARQALHRYGLTHDENEGLRASFRETPPAWAPNEPPGSWCVSYVSQPGPFDQHDFFLYLDDATGTLLYILGPHGRLRLAERKL